LTRSQITQLFTPDLTDYPNRRYDLDWLRVLAFGVLIFYHIGMMYVQNWNYHIKSEYKSDFLENIMLLVNPWRIPLLWMISGIAIRFILAKVAIQQFLIVRSYRLLLPLLFAILVIIPPQLYYQMKFQGEITMNYWTFLQHFFVLNDPLFKQHQAGIFHHIDVNHLWYLRELWKFSLALVMLIPFLNSRYVTKLLDGLTKQHGFVLTLLLTCPFLLIEILIPDPNNALGFAFLTLGYLLGWRVEIWHKLKQNCFLFLGVALVFYIILVFFYHYFWLNQPANHHSMTLLIGAIIHSIDRTLWLLAILGLGHKYLNRNSPLLSYFNEAVYPYYILHQTFIIVIGYQLSQHHLGPIIEPLLLIILTFISCMLGFDIIRRVHILRPLFGLKMKIELPIWALYLMRAVLIIILVLFGLKVLI